MNRKPTRAVDAVKWQPDIVAMSGLEIGRISRGGVIDAVYEAVAAAKVANEYLERLTNGKP